MVVKHTWNTNGADKYPTLEQADWFANKIEEVRKDFCTVFGGKECGFNECVGCMYKEDNCPMALLSTLPYEVHTRIWCNDTVITKANGKKMWEED